MLGLIEVGDGCDYLVGDGVFVVEGYLDGDWYYFVNCG